MEKLFTTIKRWPKKWQEAGLTFLAIGILLSLIAAAIGFSALYFLGDRLNKALNPSAATPPALARFNLDKAAELLNK